MVIGDLLPALTFSLKTLKREAFYVDYGDDEGKVELTDYKMMDINFTKGTVDAVSQSIVTVVTSPSEEYVLMSTFTSELAYLTSLSINVGTPGNFIIKVKQKMNSNLKYLIRSVYVL